MMRTLKKMMALLLTAAVLATLTACGQGDATTDAGGGSPAGVSGSSFPEHEITMVIPYPAGGGFDLQTRVIIRYMEKYLPNQVTIVPTNVTGVANVAGSTQLYAAKPDGYNIGIVSLGDSTAQELLNPDPVAYKTADFDYIGCWTIDTRAMAFTDDITATTWDELVAESEKEPIRFGTGGQGGAQHTDPLIVDLFTDVNFRFIHYEGNGQIVPALGRGEVSGQLGSISTTVRQEEQDLGRVFCIFADERDPAYPDIPTALEVGMPQEQYEEIMNCAFFGTARIMFAPPDTDPEALEILRQAFWDALHDEELKKEFATADYQWQPMTGEETEEMIMAKLESLETSGDVIEILREASRG